MKAHWHAILFLLVSANAYGWKFPDDPNKRTEKCTEGDVSECVLASKSAGEYEIGLGEKPYAGRGIAKDGCDLGDKSKPKATAESCYLAGKYFTLSGKAIEGKMYFARACRLQPTRFTCSGEELSVPDSDKVDANVETKNAASEASEDQKKGTKSKPSQASSSAKSKQNWIQIDNDWSHTPLKCKPWAAGIECLTMVKAGQDCGLALLSVDAFDSNGELVAKIGCQLSDPKKGVEYGVECTTSKLKKTPEKTTLRVELCS
jgi:hypothetical protein